MSEIVKNIKPVCTGEINFCEKQDSLIEDDHELNDPNFRELVFGREPKVFISDKLGSVADFKENNPIYVNSRAWGLI